MENIRRNLGMPLRELTRANRSQLRLRKPWWLWLNRSDDLNIIFRHQKRLIREGIVTWGYAIQVNQMMFEVGNGNCPGELVYSLTLSEAVTPYYLAEISARLYALKGTNPMEPSLQGIAHYLTDELIRVYGLAVPDQLSPELPCKISTTMFFRKHLPQRRFITPLMPILVCPTEPHIAMPLPEFFWTPKLRHILLHHFA